MKIQGKGFSKVAMSVIALFMATTSNASFIRGNGADGVVCGDDQVRILDSVEAEMRSIRIDISKFGETEEDQIGGYLNRLAKVDPDRSQRLAKEYEGFWDNANVGNWDIPEIDDSNQFALPEGCVLKQLAAQEHIGDSVFYVIKDTIYNRLNSVDRTLLVLHELIYREALRLGFKDSITTRYFLQFTASDRMDNVELSRYVNILKDVHFPAVRTFTNLPNFLNEVTFNLDGLEFYPNGSLKMGTLSSTSKVNYFDPILSRESAIYGLKLEKCRDGKSKPVNMGYSFVFLPNGQLKYLAREYANRKFGTTAKVEGGLRWIVELSENGKFNRDFSYTSSCIIE